MSKGKHGLLSDLAEMSEEDFQKLLKAIEGGGAPTNINRARQLGAALLKLAGFPLRPWGTP